MRSSSLGVGFLAADTFAQHFLTYKHFHLKNRQMVRAVGRNEAILGCWAAQSLYQFLQPRLGVVQRLAMPAYLGQFRFQGHQHKTTRSIKSLVQVYCGNYGLEGLLQYGIPILASRFRFPLTKRQILAEGQAPRGFG